MVDARWVRAEHRATRIAQTVPIGVAGARRSPSPVVNAATGPEVQEQQGSSQQATKPVNGRTATLSLGRPSGSVSRARAEMHHGRRTLAMATELLRYRLLQTSTTTGSIASRSSSSPPVTQRRSAARSDPSRPWQTTRNKTCIPHPRTQPHESRAGPSD
ncbi:hypothetical protein D1007_54023 [Hordeum vulgare]|nr:hypothetical protein D1007_54023 [Hordeum vulgare]